MIINYNRTTTFLFFPHKTYMLTDSSFEFASEGPVVAVTVNVLKHIALFLLIHLKILPFENQPYHLDSLAVQLPIASFTQRERERKRERGREHSNSSSQHFNSSSQISGTSSQHSDSSSQHSDSYSQQSDSSSQNYGSSSQ